MTRDTVRIAVAAAVLLGCVVPAAQAPAKKPNVLVIMGDDIGWFNPSIYHHGIMGYETPNIDRIGNLMKILIGYPDEKAEAAIIELNRAEEMPAPAGPGGAPPEAAIPSRRCSTRARRSTASRSRPPSRPTSSTWCSRPAR